jgi:hypothetical protein
MSDNWKDLSDLIDELVRKLDPKKEGKSDD